MRFWQQQHYNNYQFSSESSGGNNNNNININDNITITSINTHNHHGLEILNNTTLNFARPQLPAHTASITATQKKLRELPRIITNFPKRKSCQQQPQPQQNEIKASISNNNNNNNNNKKKSNVQQSVKFALDPSHSRKHQKSESDHNIITNSNNTLYKKNGNVNDNRYRVLRRSSAPVTGLSYNNSNKPPVSRIDLLTGRQTGRESEENSNIPTVIVDKHGHVNDKHNVSESSLSSSPPQQSRNNDYENNFNNINNINNSNFSSSISSSLASNSCSLSPFIPPSLTPSSSVSSLNSSIGQLSPFFTSNTNKDTNNNDNNDNNNDRGRILLHTMSTTLPSQSQHPPPSSSLTAQLQPPSSNNFNTRPKSKSISTEHPFAIEPFMSPVTPASYGDLPWSPAVSFLSSLASATTNTPLPDDEGQQVGDYVLGKVIGRGGFSTVREGYTIDDSCTMEKVAVKIVKNNQDCEENDRVQSLLEREIAIWRELDHPNILPMFSAEETEYATFIFSEFCPGGTLLNYIKNNSSQPGKGLSEEESRTIFLEIAEALRYLHNDMRLIHKDVKLDNILLDKDGNWKLCDFGLTEFQNPEVNGFANLDETAGGSLAYSSPEQLRSKTSIRNPAVDIWSLGVVLFAMVTGQLPFTDGYEPRLQYNIINGRYDESILHKAGASKELCDLLKGMFKTKPEQRLTINQVLEHSWCQP